MTVSSNYSRRRLGRRGFTYVELAISITVLGMVMGAAFMLSLRSSAAYRTSDSRANIGTEARRALHFALEDLSSSGPNVLQVDPGAEGGSTIDYRMATEFTAGAIVWSELRRLAFEYETGELDDGLDNNGNGLIDEGILVFTRGVGDPDQKRVVLCHNVSEFLEGEVPDGVNDENTNGLVDEAGFSISRNGSSITVALSLEEIDSDGNYFQRTLSSTTTMRN